MDYIDVAQARDMPGLKLVLTVGMPGVWGQGIKKILEFKKIPYVAVAHYLEQANEDLLDWTGVRSAPVLIDDDNKAFSRWLDMIMVAERLEPTPSVLPKDSAERAQVFGIVNELAGEWGFGWCRRLIMIEDVSPLRPPGAEVDPGVFRKQVAEYGINPQATAASAKRIADILEMLSDRLLAQKAAGSPYLVGKQITAADIYWATFSALLDPLPHEVNPMPPLFRQVFEVRDPVILAAADPILITHRDLMFKEYLGLPIEF